jgi:hypothetical protein
MHKGYRTIDGIEYLLNGTVSGNTPEDTKQKAIAEAQRMRKHHQKVRAIRRNSFLYAMYTHG